MRGSRDKNIHLLTRLRNVVLIKDLDKGVPPPPPLTQSLRFAVLHNNYQIFAYSCYCVAQIDLLVYLHPAPHSYIPLLIIIIL